MQAMTIKVRGWKCPERGEIADDPSGEATRPLEKH